MISVTDFPKSRFEMLNLLFKGTFPTNGMERWTQYIQVLRVILPFIFMSMMYMFIRKKLTTKFTFHNKSMLQHVTIPISRRVISADLNIDIPFLSNIASSFPSTTFLSRIRAKWCSPIIMTCLDTMTSHGIDYCRWTAPQFFGNWVNTFLECLVLVDKPGLITKLRVVSSYLFHSIYYTLIALVPQHCVVRTVRGVPI